MPIEITKESNSILHQKLSNVNDIDLDIKNLIGEMKRLMKEASGIGLAANQAGHNLRIFVIEETLAKENEVPDVYINPEITEYSKDLIQAEEGCLSIPEFWPQIKRSKKIKIKALDENGKKIKLKARGLLARVLQHETDHLNGLLIKDRIHSK